MVQSLREVDGAAELEVEAHADSLVFEDHLQWSERRHHLLLMNRRSRLGEEDSFLFWFLPKRWARLIARADYSTSST